MNWMISVDDTQWKCAGCNRGQVYPTVFQGKAACMGSSPMLYLTHMLTSSTRITVFAGGFQYSRFHVRCTIVVIRQACGSDELARQKKVIR